MTSKTDFQSAAHPRQFGFRLLTIFLGLVFSISLLGWFYLKASKARIHNEAGSALQTIADLKASQIDQWRQERMADARVISEDAMLADEIAAWLAHSGRPETEAKLRRWLESLKNNYRYSTALLLDTQARVRMAVPFPGAEFGDEVRREVLKILSGGGIFISDLYRNPGGAKIHQDLCIPILESPGTRGAAIVVLQIDPDLFLYPMIQSWPTPSPSAESLLVRRDGDAVVYLNELRHRKGTALNQRAPADAVNLPAAMAVRGVRGVVDGVDYQGRAVVAALRPVPGSDWFLICKIDSAEIYQPFHRLAWQAGLVMLALILLSAVWTHLLWRRQQQRWLLDQQEALRQLNADLERRVSEQTSEIRDSYSKANAERQKLYDVLETLPAYVALLTPDYRVPFANRVFRERFGEPGGRRCHEFLFDRAEPCETCETYTVLKTGTRHRWEWTGPDARDYDVHDFPFTDTDGSPLILEMGLDVTERKQAEAALREMNETLELRVRERTAEVRESEAALQRSQEIAHLGSWELDLTKNRLTWSDEVYRIFGLTPREFAATFEAFLERVHPEDRDAVASAYAGSIEEGRDAYEIEHRIVRKSTGEVRVVHEKCAHFRDATGRVARSIGMVHDITERRQAEEILRESEATLRGILDATQESIWLFSPAGVALAGNATAFRRFGQPASRIVGKPMTEFLSPELAASRGTRLREVAETGLPVEFEDERDGILFRHSFYPVKDAEGRVASVAIFSRDITQSRRDEAALRESGDRFRIALQNSAITVATLDRDLRYTWVHNTRHGFKLAQVLGRRPDELIDPQDAADLMAFLERALASGEPQRGTVRGRTRGEGWVYDITAEPLADASGRRGGLTVAMLDITERTRMEEDLLELERFKLRERSQKEWQTTFDFITDPISIHDRNGRLVKANKAFMDYFGLGADALGTRHCYSVFGRLGVSADDCPMARTVRSGAPATREVPDPARARILEISTFPHETHDGSPEGCIHVIKDVTARKENEMQLIMNERLAALGQMAAGIAHEINNPLATIAGCAEGLSNRTRKGQMDPVLFQDYLGIIEEEIGRCKAITASMLSFVRKGDPQRQVLNIHEVMDRTLELIGFQGRLRNVDLLKDYAAWVEPVKAAEVELKQVFVALLSNALDAMCDAGSLSIATSGDARSVRISIRDSGPGIPPEIADRIFDPFFTTKQGEGGTGLGLSIARRIVESLGGSLTATTTSGGGAAVTVILPRAVPAADHGANPSCVGRDTSRTTG